MHPLAADSELEPPVARVALDEAKPPRPRRARFRGRGRRRVERARERWHGYRRRVAESHDAAAGIAELAHGRARARPSG